MRIDDNNKGLSQLQPLQVAGSPIKKLTFMAILVAMALTIFIIEAQIPVPIPIPGVKLGLANSVTLFALFFTSSKERNIGKLTVANVFMILICRIVLGATFTGRLVSFMYSIAGGVLGFSAQVLMKQFVSRKQIWAVGAVGAIFHNIGQVAVAIFLTSTPVIAMYLPILIVVGIITGIITGLAAQLTIERLGNYS